MTGALTTGNLPLEGLHSNSVIRINGFPEMNFAVSHGNIAVKQTCLCYIWPTITLK